MNIKIFSLLSFFLISFIDVKGALLSQNPVVLGTTQDGVPITEENFLELILTHEFKNAHLSGGNLSGVCFNWRDYSGVDLSKAVLWLSIFYKVDLTGANLNRADFWGAILYNVNFSEADLSGADLSEADLGDVTFSNTKLEKTIMHKEQALRLGLNIKEEGILTPERIEKVCVGYQRENVENYIGVFTSLIVAFYYKGTQEVPSILAQRELSFADLPSNKGKTEYHYTVLGVRYQRWRMYDKAIEYFKKVLKITEKLDHRELVTAITHSRLGDLWKIQKKYDKAIKSYVKALEIRTKRYRKEPYPLFAIFYKKLGDIYRIKTSEAGKDDYEEALKSYFNGITLIQEVHNQPSPLAAMLYKDLGDLYKEQKEYDLAIVYYNGALARYPVLDPDIALCYDNLSNVHKLKEEFVQATKYYDMAEEKRKNIYKANFK